MLSTPGTSRSSSSWCTCRRGCGVPGDRVCITCHQLTSEGVDLLVATNSSVSGGGHCAELYGLMSFPHPPESQPHDDDGDE